MGGVPCELVTHCPRWPFFGGVCSVPRCVLRAPHLDGLLEATFPLSWGRGGGPESEKGMEGGAWGAGSKDGVLQDPLGTPPGARPW